VSEQWSDGEGDKHDAMKKRDDKEGKMVEKDGM
jgi:hypothetical protein